MQCHSVALQKTSVVSSSALEKLHGFHAGQKSACRGEGGRGIFSRSWRLGHMHRAVHLPGHMGGRRRRRCDLKDSGWCQYAVWSRKRQKRRCLPCCSTFESPM